MIWTTIIVKCACSEIIFFLFRIAILIKTIIRLIILGLTKSDEITFVLRAVWNREVKVNVDSFTYRRLLFWLSLPISAHENELVFKVIVSVVLEVLLRNLVQR